MRVADYAHHPSLDIAIAIAAPAPYQKGVAAHLAVLSHRSGDYSRVVQRVADGLYCPHALAEVYTI